LPQESVPEELLLRRRARRQLISQGEDNQKTCGNDAGLPGRGADCLNGFGSDLIQDGNFSQCDEAEDFCAEEE
jgi:hypothetical protein